MPVHPDPSKLSPLPVPSPVEQDASRALSLAIAARISAAGGAIPFSEFMEQALYAPTLGYYMNDTPKFGAAGDFVTAPELSSLFGDCIAAFCRPILAELTQQAPVILEAGAGSGALCLSVLRALARTGPLPARYLILEKSPRLREVQRTRLAAHPELAALVEWVPEIPQALNGVILANELLDALPCARFTVHEGRLRELGVGWQGETFQWTLLDHPPEGHERLNGIRSAEGYTSELPLAAERWVGGAARRLGRGVLLLLDYGFPQREYYHHDRVDGTLMCHYRHRVHPDPLVLVGLQDLTVHIDFTAIAEAALAAGAEVRGYTHQAGFLLGLGLTDRIEEVVDDRERRRLVHEAKLLTLPSEMGELFKVMAVARGLALDPPGFHLLDLRSRL